MSQTLLVVLSKTNFFLHCFSWLEALNLWQKLKDFCTRPADILLFTPSRLQLRRLQPSYRFRFNKEFSPLFLLMKFNSFYRFQSIKMATLFFQIFHFSKDFFVANVKYFNSFLKVSVHKDVDFDVYWFNYCCSKAFTGFISENISR